MEQTDPRVDVDKFRSVFPRTAGDVPGFDEEDVFTQIQQGTSDTQCFSPQKTPKAPQSAESSERERLSQLGCKKRKYSLCKASPDKVLKKYNDGYYARLANACVEKHNEIEKLKNKLNACENKIEHLVCQNIELSKQNQVLLKLKESQLVDLQFKEKEIEELKKNIDTREDIESSLIKDLRQNEDKYNHMYSNYTNLESKLKTAQSNNLNLEKALKDVQHCDEKKIFELNKEIRVLKMEKEQVSLEKNAEIENYKSREEKYKAETEKLIGDYGVELTELKKIEALTSAMIKSTVKRKAEIERLKKGHDVKLRDINEQHKITQETESFEKLKKHLEERKEKQKLENAQTERATREIEDFGKYLLERDGSLLKIIKEKQREDIKETTVDDRKYDGKQKDEGFKSVEKCREGKKADQSRREKEELDNLSKNVKEREENEKNVARTRKDVKVVKALSVSEIEFDNLLKTTKQESRDKLTKDSSAKTKRAISFTTETDNETGKQMRVDQLPEGASKNSGVSKGMSSQHWIAEVEYDFIFQIEQTYIQSQRKAVISKNIYSEFEARIDKTKGKNEDLYKQLG